MSILHQYFGFGGRINRGRFWLLSILLIVFSIVAWVRGVPGRLSSFWG